MILLSLMYSGIIDNINSRMFLILLIAILGIILLIIYYFLNKKEIEEILGGKITDIIKRKKRERK